MYKYFAAMVAVCLLGAVIAYPAQDTSITIREVRNPNELAAWLNANAADAEARLAAGGSVADALALINAADAGTAKVTLQADKADDAGDYYGILATDGSGLAIQSDEGAKGTLSTRLTIGNTGILTMKGGATVDNTTSASILNLTETTVAITGNATVSGTETIAGALAANGGITVDSTAFSVADTSGNTAIAGTLAVTGVGTFTAESVHNGGIDADYVTADSGTGGGIDTKDAGTLMIGESTATKVEVADTGVETEVQGDLDVLVNTTLKGTVAITGATTLTGGCTDIDAATAATMLLGKSTATRVEIADTAVITEVEGPLIATEDIQSNELDAETATALLIGKATATGVTIGASDANTTVAGDLTVSGGDITASGNDAKIWLGTNGYFQVSSGALQFVGYNSFTNVVDADITQ